MLANDFNQFYPDAVNSFKASDPWFQRFMGRNDLSLHRQTKISQKLCMKNSVHSINTSIRYKKMTILNSIALPIWTTLTVDCRGAQSIPIRTTGNDKTCVLGILAETNGYFQGKKNTQGPISARSSR